MTPQRQIIGLNGRPLTERVKPMLLNNTTRTGADIAFSSPEIQNPLLNPINFYLPYSSKILNQWIRYFDRFDPLVGNCIDLHGYFPISKFDLKLDEDDKEILYIYERCANEMDLFNRYLEMSREYELLGEMYPFLRWSDPLNHFDAMCLLNPDFIQVKMHLLALGMKPIIELEPDELLKTLVNSNDPEDMEIKQELDPVVLAAVAMGQNIRIDPFNIEQIARKASPYEPRGTSIVLRILKVLLYKDKLVNAQMAIADALVTPKIIYKLGDPTNGYMPTQDDLIDFRTLLQQQAHDPLGTIIYHYGLDLEYVGATGKILPIIPEMEWIEDQVLTGLYTNKALTHGEGPCASSDTETLTDNGFKLYDDITEQDKIATYNPETKKIEFHHYTGRVKFDVDSELILFETGVLDHFVTPNHKVWVKRSINSGSGPSNTRDFEKVRADEVRSGYEFRTVPENGWDGETPDYIQVGDRKIALLDYMRFAGLYLSEGSVEFSRTVDFVRDGDKTKAKPIEIRITQTEQHKSGINPKYHDVKKAILKAFPDAIEKQVKRKEGGYAGTFRIKGSDIATHFVLNYGEGSARKTIPKWVKSFGMDALKALIDGCYLGDGSDHENSKTAMEIYTVSKVMADDLQELAFKCGYVSSINARIRQNKKDIYRIKVVRGVYEKDRGGTPMVQKQHIKRIPYKGWVYCFEVPNHLFVMRRNGKMVITGNTYSNSTVAMRALEGRYLAKRERLEEFSKVKIWTPVAIANEFYVKRSAAASRHVEGAPAIGRGHSAEERKLNLPTTIWKQKLNLVEDTQKQQMLVTLRNKQVPDVSLHKICDILGIDYQENIQYLQSEAKIMKQMKEDYGASNPLVNPSNDGKSGIPASPMLAKPSNKPGGGSKPDASTTKEPEDLKTVDPTEKMKGASWKSASSPMEINGERDKLLASLDDTSTFLDAQGQLKPMAEVKEALGLRP
jgi:hypothetical protein